MTFAPTCWECRTGLLRLNFYFSKIGQKNSTPDQNNCGDKECITGYGEVSLQLISWGSCEVEIQGSLISPSWFLKRTDPFALDTIVILTLLLKSVISCIFQQRLDSDKLLTFSSPRIKQMKKVLDTNILQNILQISHTHRSHFWSFRFHWRKKSLAANILNCVEVGQSHILGCNSQPQPWKMHNVTFIYFTVTDDQLNWSELIRVQVSWQSAE